MAYVREIDHSSVIRSDTGLPAMIISPPLPSVKLKKRKLSRRKKTQVVRLSRWYTNKECAELLWESVPLKFRFRHARAAKRFFNSGPLLIGSAKQMTAIFGSPAFQSAQNT